MYESPIKVNNPEFGLVISEGFEDDHSIHNTVKRAAESVAEQFDRYVIHQVALTGVTVDRDELIKALRYDRDQYTKGYHEGMERGIEISSPTWIPVTERLPEEVGWYLVVVLAPFKQVRMYEFYPVHNNYGNDLWRNNDGDHVSNWFVTHWMPLPEPPKDGET